MYDVDDLIDLDRRLTGLLAKPDGWADGLRAAVSLGFLRRSWDAGTAPQSADELVDELTAAPGHPVEITAAHGWLRNSLGVVTTTCAWKDLGDDEVQLVRVYVNRSGAWLCEYWQETRAHRPTV
ncbi:hypothetical protein GCM10010168_49070 [Actinoplanes ianthinogenes]|uniref:DUF4440 domain-containing protein n=1 Tax=Actinoplanes ianthinogenes TaxID=122358 RepID=A0ABM7M305_9ACTN|nr:hypothetical protein [Actinoplanes ianthinogenes]BCJ45959.1 hypothetical protein Aiant_66160 [Actinoplanes ianthinogenes]GGR25396.1 hypothetical protein GCM10010168_49070 [Actinoplanes ianthinogenes]